MTAECDAELDVKGYSCPLPILKTKKQLVSLPQGSLLRVEATDPHAVIDFTAFCDKTDHELVAHSEAEGIHTFVLRRG
jgi:tRNA 2-thiouridine synthesizing protein A